MSAFLLEDSHFIELAAALTQSATHYDMAKFIADPDGFLPEAYCTKIANILKAENVRSIQARYGDEDDNEPPIVVGYSRAMTRKVTNPVHIIKMCDCYDYQSCETDDYEQSIAYGLIRKLRREMIMSLPGYDDAPWSFVSPEKTPPACFVAKVMP